MTDVPSRVITGHIVLSYGPRPIGNIGRHRPARVQVEVFRRVAEVSGDVGLRLGFDYARAIDSLEALPRLKERLEELRAVGHGAIFVDDLSRIFRLCPNARRPGLLDELEPYRPHLFCVRQGGLLKDLSPDLMKVILVSPGGPWRLKRTSRLLAEERREQTRKAVAASRKARSAMADGKAKELAQIADKLAADGEGRATFAAIAKEANRCGMTTTRGNPWTSASVARAIRRIPSRANASYAKIEPE
ncbi:hypothetical protein [Tropicimonas sediminicola]|uniref:Resolvase, N terminal domain n=1 Tax=Tropicimonas sediminicola TaxID=1031541 RepID=A0A239MBT1_9RHOB|nr:hypothetical protein [Tropicimonas sediminicola]SNT39484.1 hypothetical protein SAMN05421757_11521 [Tropicimonas sediminicola]